MFVSATLNPHQYQRANARRILRHQNSPFDLTRLSYFGYATRHAGSITVDADGGEADVVRVLGDLFANTIHRNA